MRRDFQIDRLAFHQFDRLAAAEIRQSQTPQLPAEPAQSQKSRRRIGADGDRDFQPLVFQLAEGDLRSVANWFWSHQLSPPSPKHAPPQASPSSLRRSRRAQPLAKVLGRNLLPLPVHARRLAVVDLHPVHAHIALAVFGSRVITPGSVIKRPPSPGQHCSTGKSSTLKFSRRTTSLHGHLARRLSSERTCPPRRAWQHLQLLQHAFGRLDFHELPDAPRNLVQRIDIQRQLHPPFAAELVHQHFGAGIAFDLLKQQRRPAGRNTCPLPALPTLQTRSVISAISRIGSTSSRIRFSSPALSRTLIQSRRSSCATPPPLSISTLHLNGGRNLPAVSGCAPASQFEGSSVAKRSAHGSGARSVIVFF